MNPVNDPRANLDRNLGDPRQPFEFDRAKTLEDAVFQAIGAASMCWAIIPRGTFDSDRAKEIGDKLIEWIRDDTADLR